MHVTEIRQGVAPIYDQWRTLSLASKELPGDIREPPPRVVPVQPRKSTHPHRPLLSEAINANSWHLTSDVSSTTINFETEDGMDEYLQFMDEFKTET